MRLKYVSKLMVFMLALGFLCPPAVWAQTGNGDAPSYPLSPQTQAAYDKILSNPATHKALTFIKQDADKTLQQQIEMTEIPAVPHHEQDKAEYFKQALQRLGLSNVHIGETGNVYGTWTGSGDGPTLVLSAHLDIAFEQGVDTSVTQKNGRYYAPGISDDDRGLAALLSVARALNTADIETVGDIVFVATVGEEDDFRGVRALFENHDDIDGFITVDGTSVRAVGHGGTTGYTIRFTFHGPGGHSFGDYQRPSAIHAMGRAIAKIAQWGQRDPKTTFNVGIVQGGTAENAKAQKATMLMEFRTDGTHAEQLKQRLFKAVDQAVAEENAKWGPEQENVTVEHHIKVKIPGGVTPMDAMIVQAAAMATTAIGKQPTFDTTGMTDANYSYGNGVPGLSLGGGGKAGNAHSLDEWYAPTNAYLGPQKILLTALGLVGVADLTAPLLPAAD